VPGGARHGRQLGCSQDGGGTSTRPTHRPGWVVGKALHQAGERRSQAQPRGAPGCETQWQDPPGVEGRDTSTASRLSPARTRWTRWLPPCIGPLPAAASAGPRPSWASGRPAQTPPGRAGPRSGEQLGCAGATRSTCGKTRSRRQRHTAPARQGRRVPAHGLQRASEMPPHPQHLACCFLQALPSRVVAKSCPQLVHLLLQETRRSVRLKSSEGSESARPQPCSPPGMPVPEPAVSATSAVQREGDESGTSRAVLCSWGPAPGSGRGLQRGSLRAQDPVWSSHLYPAVVVVDHGCHLRLLEHDLRHPHCRERGRDQRRGTNATHTSCHSHISAGHTHCTSLQRTGPPSRPSPPPTLPHRSSLWLSHPPSASRAGSAALVAAPGSLFQQWRAKPRFLTRLHRTPMPGETQRGSPRSSPAYARLSASGSAAAWKGKKVEREK